jgi:hypothetical protein
MRKERLELSRVSPLEPKSSASTSSATFARSACTERAERDCAVRLLRAVHRGPRIIADERRIRLGAGSAPHRRRIRAHPRFRLGMLRSTIMNQALSGLLVLILTVLSGIMDARGFVYAGKAWPAGQLDWTAVGQSLLAFFAGISLYIWAVRSMQALGLHTVALQSGIWFVVTAVGISAMDGTVLQWSRTQQLVALAVLAGLTWLIATAHGEAH